jgi:serine/threonine protein kinase
MGLWERLQSLLRTEKLDVTARFELLGEGFLGTMSKFHKARERKTNRIVGLKICDADKTEFFETRFRGLGKPSEGEIAASLKHPRIVETLEFGETTRGQQYIVMEFIAGSGLQTLIRHRDGRL